MKHWKLFVARRYVTCIANKPRWISLCKESIICTCRCCVQTDINVYSAKARLSSPNYGREMKVFATLTIGLSLSYDRLYDFKFVKTRPQRPCGRPFSLLKKSLELSAREFNWKKTIALTKKKELAPQLQWTSKENDNKLSNCCSDAALRCSFRIPTRRWWQLAPKTETIPETACLKYQSKT